MEFSGSLAVTRDLSVSTNITYQDAVLTTFLPDTFAVGGGYAPGSVLPGSSKWAIANTVHYEISQLPDMPFVELAHRYLSSAPVAFGNPNTRGDFNIFDARLGFTPHEHLRVLGFVDNMFNTYGILNAPFTSQTAPAYSIVRPRTFGVRLDWSL